MRAWLSHNVGGPDSLVLEHVDEPLPSAGQLLVRVLAVGINYPDSLLIRDQYQVKAPRPFAPGAEFSGVVEKAGLGATLYSPGDLVIGRCGWGGLAEKIAIDQERCIGLPRDMSPMDAAGFLFVYATAYHALRDIANLRGGETILVLGAAGGVGSAAIDVARALGARVVVAASSKAKLDYALLRGATNGVVYPPALDEPGARRELAESLKDLVGVGGADIVFDPVGGNYSEAALRCLKPGGRHLVVGFAAGIPHLPLNLVLLKRCQVLGVDWRGFLIDNPAGNQRNVASLIALWREGLIRLEAPTAFEFEDAPAAIEKVASRHALGKVVVGVST